MGEGNQVKWRGIRPIDPREAIPIQPYADFGTQVAKDHYANNSITIIHTVTSGKNLYLCSATFSVFPAATGEGYMYVRNENDALQYYLFFIRRPTDNGTMVSVSFNPPLIIPQGWDICVRSMTLNFRVRGFIFGYEV